MADRHISYDTRGGERWTIDGTPPMSVLATFEVQFHDYAHSGSEPSPHDARIVALWSRSRGRYVAERFEAIGSADDPVTVESLRGMQVGYFLREACALVPNVIQDAKGRDAFDPDYFSEDARRAASKNGPTAETLAMVASVYRASELALWKPAYMVSNLFGVPQRTATHWVKLARERGHLSSGHSNG